MKHKIHSLIMAAAATMAASSVMATEDKEVTALSKSAMSAIAFGDAGSKGIIGGGKAEGIIGGGKVQGIIGGGKAEGIIGGGKVQGIIGGGR
jgi:hypothetical protein